MRYPWFRVKVEDILGFIISKITVHFMMATFREMGRRKVGHDKVWQNRVWMWLQRLENGAYFDPILTRREDMLFERLMRHLKS